MSNIIVIILISYFSFLMLIAKLTSKKKDNSEFFSGDKKSPWYLVSFGMIGATLSGISMISVPGMVEGNNWHYLQMCFGFFFGYIIVAYVLLPLYYKLGHSSIYQYLDDRYCSGSSKTGSVLFIIAKMISSATKMYVVVLVLQNSVFDNYDISFWQTSILCVLMIWLYTRLGGIKTIVWTDTLQTLFLISSIIIILVDTLTPTLDWTLAYSEGNMISTQIFNFTDWSSPTHFVKQFFSGIFIVIVMTGLDQDMMQKNLSINSLRKSQTNMLTYGAAFIPVNALLLFIGTAMIVYFGSDPTLLPAHGDVLLPYFVEHELTPIATICLILAMISASFSSADSALTSITTSLSIDIFSIDRDKQDIRQGLKKRKFIHLSVCIVFSILITLFEQIESSSILNTIYTIVGYCYGPLLGLFAFGILTKRKVQRWAIPTIALLSPVVCYFIALTCEQLYDYKFGYELLMMNGLITYIYMYICSLFKTKDL